MSDERTTTGCWTCRLRKKKHVLGADPIDCHGYGDKPKWMDKGEREKAELAKVKVIVRKNASIKRAARFSNMNKASDGSHEPAVHLDTSPIEPRDDMNDASPRAADLIPTPLLESNNEDMLILQNQDTLMAGMGLMTPSVEMMPSEAFLNSTLVVSHNPLPSRNTFSSELREREASLLMHYFDSVFPLQYRFYNPSETETGRGWLLSLLSRTRPLYHTALSLSALHLQVLQTIQENEDQTRREQVDELFQHHDLALKELQSFIQLAEQNNDVRGKVQILACIVQFISFELFRGGTYNWEFHLQAGAALAAELITYVLSNPDSLTTRSVDTTSTAITFMAPLLHDHRENILSVIQMDTITGCRNWVLDCMCEISSLSERKTHLSLDSHSIWELDTAAQSVISRLLSGLSTTATELVSLKPGNSVRTTPEFTRYIACSVVYGADPQGKELRRWVGMTIDALKEIPEPQMIRSFTWPLTVAGCLASEEEQPFFEGKFRDGGRAGMAFGNSAQTLAVLKRCWELRRNCKGEDVCLIDWRRASQDLGVRVLFV
ncbi:fungal-specific transcription factor domain-containing protein [Bisporella sp. PMI_857]|nr:fungal-specific transcription factor domain-containing protein [Bisporella sp. PMI_857]